MQTYVVVFIHDFTGGLSADSTNTSPQSAMLLIRSSPFMSFQLTLSLVPPLHVNYTAPLPLYVNYTTPFYRCSLSYRFHSHRTFTVQLPLCSNYSQSVTLPQEPFFYTFSSSAFSKPSTVSYISPTLLHVPSSIPFHSPIFSHSYSYNRHII
jgi:hypothetical protein